MHLQSFKFLRQRVKREMQLQDNTLFEHDLGIKAKQNVDQVPSTSYDLNTLKVWSFYVQRFRRWNYKLHYLTLTLGSMSLETLTSTHYIMWRIHFIWPLTLTFGTGDTKGCVVPSTPCDLYTYIVWICYLQCLRRWCKRTDDRPTLVQNWYTLFF